MATLHRGFGADEMNLLVTFKQLSGVSKWFSTRVARRRRRRRSPGVSGKGIEADRKLPYHTRPYVISANKKYCSN